MLTPFAAFLLAQTMHCSGVVAVMVSALMLAYVSPRVIRARSRLQSFAFWDISTFLINGSLWVFVGVQIPGAVRGIAHVDGGLRHAVLLALAVTGVVIVTRLPGWKSPPCCFVLWTGARCSAAVASAGASAPCPAGRDSAARCHLPRRSPSRRTTHSGAPFPDRNLHHLRRVGRDSGDRPRPREHAARRRSLGSDARRRRPRRRIAVGPQSRRPSRP